MLDEFGAEIEHAESRLDNTVKKMAKILKLSNGKIKSFHVDSLLLDFLPIFILKFYIVNSSNKISAFKYCELCHSKDLIIVFWSVSNLKRYK